MKQREIKFRAWDKVNKKMVDVNNIDWCSHTIWCGGDKNIESLLFEDIMLLQHTGLKDKNGKEIYEGDVIQFRHRRYHVKWDRYRWQFYNKKGGMAIKFILQNLDNVEVVGNLFQNPDIFVKKKESLRDY